MRQISSTRGALAGAVVAVLLAQACGAPRRTDETQPLIGTGAKETQAIGTGGGEIALEGTRLSVPAGALPEGTSLSITSTTTAAPEENNPMSPVYRFEPEGLAFQLPVEVTMPLPAGAPGDAVIYWSKQDGAPGYDALATRLDGRILKAFVTHFSTGFVGESPASGEVTTTCSVPPEPCGACSVTCGGDTRARCAAFATTGGQACTTPSSCTCEPIPHECSVPADAACGLGGCAITCPASGAAPVATCRASASTGCAAGTTCNSCPTTPPTCRCESLAPPATGPTDGADGGTGADAGTAGGCSSDSACASGTRCDVATGQCRAVGGGELDGGTAGCMSTGDCGVGEACIGGVCQGGGVDGGTATDGGIAPACGMDADCASGMKCDSSLHRCVSADPGGADAGAPAGCQSHAECGAGQLCVAGQCQTDGGATDGGAAGPDAGTPAPQCTTDAQCSTGMRCDAGRCVPALD